MSLIKINTTNSTIRRNKQIKKALKLYKCSKY